VEAWRSYPGERPHDGRLKVRALGVNPRDNGDRIAIAALFALGSFGRHGNSGPEAGSGTHRSRQDQMKLVRRIVRGRMITKPDRRKTKSELVGVCGRRNRMSVATIQYATVAMSAHWNICPRSNVNAPRNRNPT